MLTDLEKHLFVERGISMVSKRYSKANNPLVPDYDPSKPNKYIAYLDANNLYGWAISKPLPKKNFKWKRVLPTEKEILDKKKQRKLDGFLRLILTIRRNYMKNTTAFPLPRRKSRSKKNGCRTTKTV